MRRTHAMLTITFTAFALGACAEAVDTPIESTESELVSVDNSAILTLDVDRPLLTEMTQAVQTVEFGIVGLRVNAHADGGAVVREVVEGSPAAEVGLVEGDHVVAVDGMSAIDMPLDTFLEFVRGEPGEAVELTVERDGIEEIVVVSRMPFSIEEGPRARMRALHNQTEFGGIGTVVRDVDGQLTLGPVTNGMPAEAAGLVEGEQIVGVDGFNTEGAGVYDAISVIRGEAGSIVTLDIRNADGVVRTVDIERVMMVMPERSGDRSRCGGPVGR